MLLEEQESPPAFPSGRINNNESHAMSLPGDIPEEFGFCGLEQQSVAVIEATPCASHRGKVLVMCFEI